MSKSLASLLRGSRLSQLYRSNKPLTSALPKYHPFHQIIETKPHARDEFQEWGLKSTIPNGKFKTRYIVVSELDTLERLATFEPNSGGYNWNRLRFQEMNLSPDYSGFLKDIGNNPYFEYIKSKLSTPDETIKPYTTENKHAFGKNINDFYKQNQDWTSLRKSYTEWVFHTFVKENKDVPIDSIELYLHKIYTEKNKNRPSTLGSKIIGSGGLSYNLKNRLKTTPDGILNKEIVPGRFLNADRLDRRLVAVGGFVANTTNNSNDALKNVTQIERNIGAGNARKLRWPFRVESAVIQENGSVSITVKPIKGISESNRYKTSNNMGSMANQRRRKNRPPQPASVNESEAKEFANELLNLLKNNNMKN
ncbi:uncharacterized protein SCODWIG_03185 [Saccharomycodes ludwigii]|uniref:37S ribosomal protein MRP51, mitochondrial n=1 Tax=Saccharomycodes ludwigii TaxID=36035 RepID=A0A376BA53_9ASCO|nr:hypothetical protein SCDLUD_002123 [Saccharomycodes ludwigii]KAH3902303.1 hypothetical protein SCDLUD_002123 [Saccharomycodes ludwigii]SSD61424.1 uncharacterized protein SCODWIG_03185 [Saccharomycodes ludwigii]